MWPSIFFVLLTALCQTSTAQSGNVEKGERCTDHSCPNKSLFFVVLHNDQDMKSKYDAMSETWLNELKEEFDYVFLFEHKYRLNLFLALEKAYRDVLLVRKEVEWVMVCESSTYVNVTNVQQAIAVVAATRIDSSVGGDGGVNDERIADDQTPSFSSFSASSSSASSPQMYGFGLFDNGVITPIHHYWGKAEWMHHFLYPYMRAGVLMNRAFVEQVVRGITRAKINDSSDSSRVSGGSGGGDGCVVNFQIDPSFELMKCISDHLKEYVGIRIERVGRSIFSHVRNSSLPIMRHDSRFCVFNGSNKKRISESKRTSEQKSEGESASQIASHGGDYSECLTVATFNNEQMYQLHGTFRVDTEEQKKTMSALSLDEIAFGVSTYPQSLYNDYVKDTWGRSRAVALRDVEQEDGRSAIDILFFSHALNLSLPSIDVGIANVNKGFCGKSERMFAFWAKHYLGLAYPAHFSEQEKQALDEAAVNLKAVDDITQHTEKKWFFRADDDTSIHLSRLVASLNKYDPEEALFVGEVYGYQEAPYLTGGGGVVMSRGALKKWASCGSACRCPSIDYFDDMFLGQCCQFLGIRFIDEPGFHQEPPSAYSPALLAFETPITFHRIAKNPNPLQVYREMIES